MTNLEFINLKPGDRIRYYLVYDGWVETTCTSHAFYNSDAGDPGWEVETDDGVISIDNDLELI